MLKQFSYLYLLVRLGPEKVGILILNTDPSQIGFTYGIKRREVI
jgi:hypothetical protein